MNRILEKIGDVTLDFNKDAFLRKAHILQKLSKEDRVRWRFYERRSGARQTRQSTNHTEVCGNEHRGAETGGQHVIKGMELVKHYIRHPTPLIAAIILVGAHGYSMALPSQHEDVSSKNPHIMYVQNKTVVDVIRERQQATAQLFEPHSYAIDLFRKEAGSGKYTSCDRMTKMTEKVLPLARAVSEFVGPRASIDHPLTAERCNQLKSQLEQMETIIGSEAYAEENATAQCIEELESNVLDLNIPLNHQEMESYAYGIVRQLKGLFSVGKGTCWN